MVSPLSGIRIVAFTHYAAGPIAAQYLGSLGADVVKIESVSGDYQREGIREADAQPGTPSPYYLGMNRNQRSIAIDLKTREGRRAIEEVLKTADVLIENFRPGALDRMELGYDAISKRYPRLIYCSISAYDPTGPARDRPGQDLLLQALSGLASQTGPADAPPMAAGGYIMDGYTAAQAVIGVQAALRYRELTGDGQWVRVDMISCALHLLASETTYALNAKSVPPRGRHGIAHIHQPAPYGIYATNDGAIAVVSKPDLLPRIAESLGILEEVLPLLADNGAWTRRDDIAAILARCLVQMGQSEAVDVLEATGALVAPVRTLLEALDDPAVAHGNMVREINHVYGGRYRVLIEPLKMTKSPIVFERPSPALGEHTREILAETSLPPDEIDALVDAGIARIADSAL